MKEKRKVNWFAFVVIIALIIVVGILIWYFFQGNAVNLDQTQLKQLYENGLLPGDKKIAWITDSKISVVMYPNIVTITGYVSLDGKLIQYTSNITKIFYSDQISGIMQGKGFISPTDSEASSIWSRLLFTFLPIFIIFFGSIYIMLRLSKSTSGGMNPFSMGKNRAKKQKTETRFTDVAGIKEEKLELEEIVDYLKYPQRYAQMGARTPKGVLLVGPPGTGKTLLAKAVAGEAGVPFFSISGAEFEEMFVGVGASRVREMFNTAKKSAPCIIFIDEIDAVGRKRSSAANSANEQTLNQLLVEMDGFDTNVGIIIIAATNRKDVLDEALLRPGRFDREITLSWPDIKEREAILRLHARNKNISPKVNFHRIAERTPGFSGAQLENVLNEATLLAVRLSKKVVDIQQIDEAIDRVVGGPAKTSRVINPTDKKTVSFHEAGHALIGLKVAAASKVQKVTIIPRGQAGGYTIMTPKEETMFYSKNHLIATVTGYLGGRASEEIMFGKTNITTGAHDDLEKATNIARRMVTEFGMSEKLGLAQFENPKDDNNPFAKSTISNEIANSIDIEIKAILDSCYQEAKKVIQANRKLLDLIAKSLMTLETITAEQIEYINVHEELPIEVIEMEKANQKAELDKKQPSSDDNDIAASTPGSSSSDNLPEDDEVIKAKPK